MKIIIGSKNPAKVLAVKLGFSHYNHAIFNAIDVPTGVNNQPFSDEETIKGAINRAFNAMQSGEGDLGIGLEGGIVQTEYGLFLCNWGALVVRDLPHPIIGGGARIPLPTEICEQLLEGKELGPVMESYTKNNNVRTQEGAIGIFTNGQIVRSDMFLHVVKLLVGQLEFQKM